MTRGRLGLPVLASRVCGFRAFTSLALKCGVCLIVGLGGSSRGQVFLILVLCWGQSVEWRD